MWLERCARFLSKILRKRMYVIWPYKTCRNHIVVIQIFSEYSNFCNEKVNQGPCFPYTLRYETALGSSERPIGTQEEI